MLCVIFSVVCPVHQRQIVLTKVQPEKRKGQRTVNICTHALNIARRCVLSKDTDIMKTEVYL